MAAWAVYFLTYLAGFATPILILRRLFAKSEDGSGCLLNTLLVLLGGVCILIVWMGVN